MKDKKRNDDGLATVTPIRPGIEPNNTTALGEGAPALPPLDESPDDDGTWGTTPRRRMRADDPDKTTTFTANDTTEFGDPASTRALAVDTAMDDETTRDVLADDTYTADEHAHPAARPRRLSTPRRSWRVGSLALLAVLGAVIGLLTAGSHGRPQPPPRQAANRTTTSTPAQTPTNETARHPHPARHTTRPHHHPARPQHHHRAARPKPPAATTHNAAASHTTNASTGTGSTGASSGQSTPQPTSVSYQPGGTSGVVCV
jgi:hypothetical protein